VKVGENFNYTN